MLLRDLSNNNGLEAGLKEIADRNTDAFYLKATEGLGFRDSTYPPFRDAIAKRGAVSGAYLFLHHDEDGEAQARAFLAYARPKAGDLQPVVDVEQGSAALSAHVAYKALAALEADGFAPILYTSTSWLSTLLKLEPRLGRFRVWQAEYGPVLHRVPGFRVIAWQFTDRQVVGKGPLRTDGSRLFVRRLSDLEFRPKKPNPPTPAPGPKPAPAPTPKPKPRPKRRHRVGAWVAHNGVWMRVGGWLWRRWKKCHPKYKGT